VGPQDETVFAGVLTSSFYDDVREGATGGRPSGWSRFWTYDERGVEGEDLLSNIRALDAAGLRFIATSQGIDIRAGGDAMSRMTTRCSRSSSAT
jgi:hypothetical protein